MLDNKIFYYGITRKIIVGFGSLFSSIKIQRESLDKSESQTVSVPIAYAPKEKFIVRLSQDPSLDKYVYTTLPRMSFEIIGINYDAARRVNKGPPIRCLNENGEVTGVFAPVPYNIEIELNVLTKTTEDGLQIIEQILPYFTPEYTMRLKVLDTPKIDLDIPVVLNSVNVRDDYDGDFSTRRFVTWTLTFTLKTNFFGPSFDQGFIHHVMVDLRSMADPDKVFAGLDMIGDPVTKEITFHWTEDPE